MGSTIYQRILRVFIQAAKESIYTFYTNFFLENEKDMKTIFGMFEGKFNAWKNMNIGFFSLLFY